MRSCVQTNQRPLRIALVSYRSRPPVGGQGLYFPPLKNFTEIYNQINNELNVSLNENKRAVRDSAQAAVQAAGRLLAP